MTFLGWLALNAVFAAIILMITGSIEMVLRDSDDERVEYLAEKRFNEMLENAEVRVIQRLEIIDEMR
jgi:hypothetical protein